MGFVPIDVPPGIVKSDSDYATSGRWIDADHVRFVKGRPEKIGGAQKFFQSTFLGIARAAAAWASYLGVQCLVFGTACRLYIWRDGTLSIITPYRLDSTSIALVNPFDTTNTSAVVTVHDTAHGIAASGVVVNFTGFAAVGGITISGDYSVTSIVDANTYTITHSAAATSTVSGGGGAGTAKYTLNCGTVDPTYLVGWGIGTWGDSTRPWGTDASLAQAQVSEPTNWSMDVYGEDLVINQTGTGIWIYDTSAGGRPSVLTNAPSQVRYAFVTSERYIFALGCTTTAAAYDPMVVRWPDIEDNTNWTPASTNTSNQRKLQGGTRLMAGTALTDGVSVVWSDSAIFLFQFTGATSVTYSSRMVADRCGLIGPHAWAKANGVAYWMSDSNFWMYSGAAQPIPNVEDIRQWVIDNLNTAYAIKSFAFYNPVYNEVWFVFPGNGSSEPSIYVMVKLDDFTWSHGTWTRSACTFYTSGDNRPIMFGTDGIVYVHEVRDDPNNNGAALPFHIELAPTDIQGGNRLVDIFGFVPDFKKQSGDISVYLYGKDHPRDDVMMSDTLTVAETDKLVDARMAGRQFGMVISGSAVGSDFRLGRWGLEVSGAGAKRGSQAGT